MLLLPDAELALRSLSFSARVPAGFVEAHPARAGVDSSCLFANLEALPELLATYFLSTVNDAFHNTRIKFSDRRATMNPRTRDDAMDWVCNAISFYRGAGKRIALAEFSN